MMTATLGEGQTRRISLEKARRRLTRYHTAQPVASGGTGEVLKAWDNEREEWVALKFLHRDDPVLVERLFREAWAQQRLDHPNICKVFEASRDEDDRPYVAMEFIDGPPLDQACAALTIEKRAKLVAQAARAVHHANGRGVVHRDLKPSNILVRTGDDGCLSPVIVDFGVALCAEAASLTRTGDLLGTPAFMAPEQARGESRSIDRRTDVYALGAVLYHLLADRPPFAAETPVVLLGRIIHDEPESPVVTQPDLPGDLCIIALKALEKEPRHRYDSALAFAEDIERWLEGRTISARPLNRPARFVRMIRRHPVTSSIVALAAAAVVIAGGLTVRTLWSARQHSVLVRTLAIEEESLAGRVRLIKGLPRHDISGELGALLAEVEGLQSRVDDMGEAGRGPGMAAVGRCHLALGNFEAALVALNSAVNAGFSPPEVESALGQVLVRQYQQALWKARRIRDPAVRLIEEQRAEQKLKLPALQLLRKATAANSGRMEMVLAVIARLEGDVERSLEYCRKSRLSAPWLYESYVEEAQALLDHADARIVEGEMDEALANIAAAGDRIEAGLEIGRSDSVFWLLEYRRLQRLVEMEATRDEARDDGVYDRAEHACLAALEIEPNRAAGHRSLASLLTRKATEGWWNWGDDPTDDFDRAMHHARRAVELEQESAMGFEVLGTVLLSKGRVLLNQSRDPTQMLTAAVQSFEKALASDPTSPVAMLNSGQALFFLASFAHSRGECADHLYSEAISVADRFLELYPGVSNAFQLKGTALTRLSEAQAARGEDPSNAAEQAVQIYEQAIRADPGNASFRNNLGLSLWVLAELQEKKGGDPLSWLERTRDSFKTATELRPDGVSAWANLSSICNSIAVAKIRRGGDPTSDIELGRVAVAEALVRHPNDFFIERSALDISSARWAMAQDQRPLELLTAAQEVIREGLAFFPDDGEALVILAEACLLRAMWSVNAGRSPDSPLTEGLDAADHAIDLNPSNALAFAVRGELRKVQADSGHRENSSLNAAAADCREAWRIDASLTGDYCREFSDKG